MASFELVLEVYDFIEVDVMLQTVDEIDRVALLEFAMRGNVGVR
jgi:hypothetical protein